MRLAKQTPKKVKTFLKKVLTDTEKYGIIKSR